ASCPCGSSSLALFFFSSRRRHTRFSRDWSSDVCSSDLGSVTSMPGYLEAYALRLAAAAERLHGVSLEALPALELIARYGSRANVLLYVDPPYLGTTRGWGNNYRCEMKTEAEHRALAAALADCRASVVLSGYDSPLYDELYAGWHRYAQVSMTGNAKTDKARTEVLWSNTRLGDQ